jgi:hypothetical protein
MHQTKTVSYAAALALAVVFLSGTAFAAPKDPNSNPNVVAYYPTGDHGVVGEYYLHTGSDLVVAAGNSGNFDQWFIGTTTESNGATVTEHSVWNLSHNGTCPNGWILVPNASADWGSYLTAGADYCVSTSTN